MSRVQTIIIEEDDGDQRLDRVHPFLYNLGGGNCTTASVEWQ